MQANQSSSEAFDMGRPPLASFSAPPGAEPLAGSSRPLVRMDETSEAFAPALTPRSVPLHLLVLDHDGALRQICAEVAAAMGFAVVQAQDLAEARAVLGRQKIDMVLLDPMPTEDGWLEALAEMKALASEAPVLVMAACASVTHAVEAMRGGAGDYLAKPFARTELAAVLQRATERPDRAGESRRLREKLRNGKSAGHLAGSSPEMEKLYRMVSKVTHTMHPVLIVGEAGTGKELVARAIHFNGPAAHKPFVPVDCGSLMPSLMEGELFGYVKGAFPGAVRGKDGLLTSAEGATVFLDDITELPVDLQAKLLRALQEKVVRPVGSTQTVPVTARVLAATHRDLTAMVEQGRFRRDLYFRLNVVSLRIPPLRERRGDIAELAQTFLDRQKREAGRALRFGDESLNLLLAYDWPGNVRELEAAVERACSLSSGPVIHRGDLPAELESQTPPWKTRAAGSLRMGELGSESESSIVSLAELERESIRRTLRLLEGDKLRAAKLLGIGKTTLYRKLKEYGIAESNDRD